MLPTELLIQRYHGEEIVPRRLALSPANLALATELIDIFRAVQGKTRAELHTELQVLEGDHTDYRVKRGLASLLSSDYSTFEIMSPLDPVLLRQRVFALSARSVPSPQASHATLTALADALGQEMGRITTLEQLRVGLYADLPEQHVLTSFDVPTPEALLHR